MEKLSTFDVIGPNMIGPSSSHTAGALKIAGLARQHAESFFTEIKQVTFILYGSFAQTYSGHGTDRALLAGFLGFEATDYRIKDAYAHAEQLGLKYEFILEFDIEPPHPNTVDIIIDISNFNIESQGTYCFKIRGLSIGGGAVEVMEI